MSGASLFHASSLACLLIIFLHQSVAAQTGVTYSKRLRVFSNIVQAASTSENGNFQADRNLLLNFLLSSGILQNDLLPSALKSAIDQYKGINNFADLSLNSTTLLQANISALCLSHVVKFGLAIAERKPWALQMLDAFGKPHPGITEGNLLWPGGFKQCRNVRATITVQNPNNVSIEEPLFSGQYCSASIVQGQMTVILMAGGPSLGLCTPDSCSAEEMALLLNEVLRQMNISIPLTIDCAKPSPPDFDTKAVLALVICSIVLIALILGTFLDIIYVQVPKWRPEHKTSTYSNGHVSENPELQPLLSQSISVVSNPKIGPLFNALVAFSVYTNGSKLLTTKQSSDSLSCIHGIRFLSMTWVLLGHCFVISITTGENVLSYMQETTKRWTFQAITNALVSVDSFFLISGLLVSYLSLKELKKRDGKLNWFLFYFHRFWRLTPVIMLVIMAYACLGEYWGSGPLWKDSSAERDNCNQNWWSNLLYINNFVDFEHICLAQTWYLSNDMQFYILSPLIFMPLFFRPLLGYMIAGAFIIATAIVPGVLTAKYSFPPSLVAKLDVPFNIMEYMKVYYVKPWNRMGVYVVGMLAGYFLYRTDCKLKMSRAVNCVLWSVAAGVALVILYGLYDASNDHPITVSVSAFYNSVSRQMWGICIAWVIIACVTGNGGFVNTILSWSGFVSLSRLTYCIYLIHLIVIEVYLTNGNTPFNITDLNIVILFLGLLVSCYMVAAVVSLAFEAPMMGLEKVLLQGKSSTDKSLKLPTREK